MLAALVVYIYFPIKMEAIPSKKLKLEEGNLKTEEEYVNSGKTFIEGSTSIDILDDDCMDIIFSYLDRVDLIRIEAVSKKWQELSLKTWKRFRTLNTEKDFEKKFELKHLKRVLKRCGRYLTHLDLMVSRLESSRKKLLQSIPVIISKYCKNLIHLGIITYQQRESDWEQLEDSVLTNLKSLFIDVRYDVAVQINMSHILKRAVKLEKIHLESSNGVKDSSLLHISDKCTELSIPGVEDSGVLSQVFKTVPRLEKLDISGPRSSILPGILEPVSSQLKSLNVKSMDIDFFSRNQYQFLNFQNLQDLNISFNRGVNDEVLDILISKCPLIEKLSLAQCYSITDNGFLKLGKLEKLLWLDITLTEISDAALTQFAQMANQLLEFHCCSCYNLTDIGLISLVTFCSDLKFLHFEISSDKIFTYLFFQSVLKVVENRLNRAPLTIHVGFNSAEVAWKELEEFEAAVKREVKRLKLTESSARSSKYNVCNVKFTRLYESEERINKAKLWYIAEPLE